MKLPRDLYNDAPPERRTRIENNPTLLFSWWCTMFAAVIILFRLGGRLVRNNVLFREDKIMALSIIPLMIRMGFVHVILLYGTNNVATTGMGELEIYRRSIGSRLVLASRIFYALSIWTAKLSVSEFLKRMTARIWKKSYEVGLRGIRVFLVVTFFAVVISTLAECQPFHHYWQVVPDPGPQCRQGYAQLITMGVADVITDVLLIIFPIPIVLNSAMGLKRKLSLIALFSLSVILIIITTYRVPAVIHHKGRQQYRTVWASGEILAAAAVSNAVVLGSFLRDRGVKKAKYKCESTTDSMDNPSIRRPTITAQQWGSDEDLIRGMGIKLDPKLHQHQNVPRAPPVVVPATSAPGGEAMSFSNHNWQFPDAHTEDSRDSEETDLKIAVIEDAPPSAGEVRMTHRPTASFFDVGGLLEDQPAQPRGSAPSRASITSAQDFAASRRGSRALLSDLGGLLSPSTSRQPASSSRRVSRPGPVAEEGYEMSTRASQSRTKSAPTGVESPMLSRQETIQTLRDVGGLLDRGKH